jgi:hypothetical protein
MEVIRMAMNKLLTAGTILAVMEMLTACTFMDPYNVTYKSVSPEEIRDVTGVWGEYRLNASYTYPPVDGAHIVYSGYTNARLDLPIPDEAGATWINEKGESVEFLVPINRELFPAINSNQHYEFVFELRQNDIRQVELIVHDGNNMRSKKKKVMLYCALPDNSCIFNTPFTEDTYYDYDSLTPEQLNKLREEQAAERRIMAPIDKAIREEFGDQVPKNKHNNVDD